VARRWYSQELEGLIDDPDLSNNTSGALLIGLSNYSSEAD
jgi:hypothetical protein